MGDIFFMIEKRIIESNSFSNKVIRLVFLLVLCLVFLSLVSSVSAQIFTPGTGNSIQTFINNATTTDTTIQLNQGNYTNINNLNVTRNLTIIGNGQVNIRSSTGGTLFNITSANVTIRNLNISGYTTAIAINNNTTNIRIIGNCINTTGNSITFSTGATVFRGVQLENNTINGTTAVYRGSTSATRFEISFNHNNITGTSGTGVSLYASSSNNTITFTSNNITGAGTGVFLSASSSNNTITFTSNNITGAGTGVFLYAYSSNNTITFTSNNITGNSGTSYGVSLYASSSNNTITFTSNNITGTSYGVDLYAYSSNNTLLRFVGNNINSNSIAMDIYVDFNTNLIGLSLLNNTFNSNGTGLRFYLYSNSVLRNINVTGNTIKATNVGIGFSVNSGSSNVTVAVNYNSILASIGVNFTDPNIINVNSNFDYNWWGSNAGPTSSYHALWPVNNYYVMGISTSVASLSRSIGENLAVNYRFVLNGTSNNANAATKFSPFTVNIMVNGKLWKGVDGRSSVTYMIPLSAIDNAITATLNGVDSVVKYKASKMVTTLVVGNLKPLFNKANVIIVTARDKNGKLLANKNVALYVNGKLVKTVKTNSAGVASFNYKFTTRKAHKVQAKFTSDTTHTASNSKTLSLIPKDKTTLTLAKFTAKYNKKATLKATLKNNKNKALAKRVVKFYANNKYLGQAKTNAKGVATLTKKITVKGVVNFIAKYAGDKTNHDSSYTRTITVK